MLHFVRSFVLTLTRNNGKTSVMKPEITFCFRFSEILFIARLILIRTSELDWVREEKDTVPSILI